MKGWTEDAYEDRLDHAHPHTSDALLDFLRHRSAEAIAIYELRRKPWYRRIHWTAALVWTAVIGFTVATWTVVALGIAVLVGAI